MEESESDLPKDQGQEPTPVSALSPPPPVSPMKEELKLPSVNTIKETINSRPTSSKSSTSSAASLLENVESKPNLYTHFSPLREPVFAGLTKRQLLLLTAIGLSEFFGAMVYSIHGPFFPKEASRKNVSPSQFGFTFGIFEVAVLIFSPIFARMLRKDSITPTLLYHLGVFTTAVGALIFSLLGFVSDPALFFIGSLVIRAVRGIGEAGFITASFSLIAEEFPEAVSSFGSMQSFFALGIICGPVMGGALEDALYTEDEKFFLTFGVLSGIYVMSAIAGLFLLPKSEGHSPELDGRKSIRLTQILSILKIGSVRLAAFSILCAAFTIGVLNVTLELHLRSFNLHPVILGGIFVISNGLYALSSPVWGWLLQKFSNPKYFILDGSILICTAFLLIGPAPFIPLDTTIFYICIALVLHGIGIGAVLSSSFNLTMRKAVEFGYELNIDTYGISTFLWIGMFSLGFCLGSSVSGIMYDNLNFRDSSWLIIGMQALLMLSTILSLWNTRNTETSHRSLNIRIDPEGKPLLKSDLKVYPKEENERVSSSGKYGAIHQD